ncbi:hypothetical protein AAFF_G00039450 [Aldrovandia affinis]|uniref:Uncharacterized protein n=1 Tax=Aldrovandia affinis TaxID=143900 RepID=A0AAD7WGD0_9TELE|nr:hypothetical protein AAFF_G00039450 [Aldrovandia affinis]
MCPSLGMCECESVGRIYTVMLAGDTPRNPLLPPAPGCSALSSLITLVSTTPGSLPATCHPRSAKSCLSEADLQTAAAPDDTSLREKNILTAAGVCPRVQLIHAQSA